MTEVTTVLVPIPPRCARIDTGSRDNSPMQTKRITALVLASGLLFAACGSDSDDSSTADADPSGSETTMGDMADMDDSDDMDLDAMNMGDATATPAAQVEGADLNSGTFALLETRPPDDYEDTAGSADLARSDAGTTVTIELTGLVPGVDYISHLHEAPCADGGGDHYKFDPEGSDLPPNEVHLAFTADADGGGFMTAENDMIAGDDAVAIIVHPSDLLDNKIACADF